MKNGVRVADLRASSKREAASLLKVIAKPPAGTVKERITRAARQLGWSYQRTEDIWRGDAARIEAWEMDMLRSYVTKD